MRAFFIGCFLLLPGLAGGADSLSLARQFHDDGLYALALARIVRDQPAEPNRPGWVQWESLRLTLLSKLGQPAELVERVKQVPEGAPKEFRQKAYGHAAWAHLERAEGQAARVYLARLLWQFSLAPADHQWARRLVIRSYLVEHKADEAYRAMLRYQQDFAPLPREVASEFVQGLLAEERTTEAMTWLADVDPASSASLRLQLKAGLVAPADAIIRAQAAARAQPGGATDFTVIVAEAAKLSGDVRLHIDALEQQLGVAEKPDVVAMDLWRAYVARGEIAGNRAQLLHGDDASWLAMAAGTSDPQEGRSAYAYLVQRHTDPETRDLALSRLFASLAAGRPDAAVRLFAAMPWGEQKDAPNLVGRMVDRVGQGMPANDMRPLWLAASRFAASQRSFGVAADYCAQVVAASDMRIPDALATEAAAAAVDHLKRAGLEADAAAFATRLAALREPLPPVQPKKPRRRK